MWRLRLPAAAGPMRGWMGSPAGGRSGGPLGKRRKPASRCAGPACRARTRGYTSERTDVLRLRSLLSLCRVELDLLVLVQRLVARCRDRGEVDEHVRRPVIGGDETKAQLCRIHYDCG